MKHLFLVNPVAGNGRAEKDLIPKIRQACIDADANFEIHLTESADETVEYTMRQAESGAHIRFYACGGDGTLNNVLNGIVGHPNAELAFVPCGTGNDFSRNYENEPFFSDIGRQLEGQAAPIDAVRTGNTYAVNMINIGVDCDVVAETERLKKYPLLKGSLAYGVGVAKVLSRGKTYRMLLELDVGTVVDEELFLAGIANGSYCGGGFKSAPYASVSDGRIDLCVVRPIKGIKILKMLAGYRKGTHLDEPAFAPYIIYKTCKRLSIEAYEPMNVSVDGEITTFERMTFEIVPGAVNFSVPKGARETNGN